MHRAILFWVMVLGSGAAVGQPEWRGSGVTEVGRWLAEVLAGWEADDPAEYWDRYIEPGAHLPDRVPISCEEFMVDTPFLETPIPHVDYNGVRLRNGIIEGCEFQTGRWNAFRLENINIQDFESTLFAFQAGVLESVGIARIEPFRFQANLTRMDRVEIEIPSTIFFWITNSILHSGSVMVHDSESIRFSRAVVHNSSIEARSQDSYVFSSSALYNGEVRLETVNSLISTSFYRNVDLFHQAEKAVTILATRFLESTLHFDVDEKLRIEEVEIIGSRIMFSDVRHIQLTDSSFSGSDISGISGTIVEYENFDEENLPWYCSDNPPRLQRLLEDGTLIPFELPAIEVEC